MTLRLLVPSLLHPQSGMNHSGRWSQPFFNSCLWGAPVKSKEVETPHLEGPKEEHFLPLPPSSLKDQNLPQEDWKGSPCQACLLMPILQSLPHPTPPHPLLQTTDGSTSAPSDVAFYLPALHLLPSPGRSLCPLLNCPPNSCPRTPSAQLISLCVVSIIPPRRGFESCVPQSPLGPAGAHSSHVC